MEQFIWLSIFLLVACTSTCQSQQRDYDSNFGSRNYRRDTGYGRPVLAMANSPRCTFNGKPVEDGTFVSSPEPCLNCSCSRGILLCYLHTCNSIVAVPGCEIVKKPGTCCPHLECKEPFGYNEYRTERTNEPGFRYKLRQDESNFFGLIGADSRTDRDLTTTPSTRKPYGKGNGPNYSSFLKGISPHRRSDTDGQSFYVQEEDYGEDELSPDKNNSAGYCFSRGRKYPEGTAMLSPTKCEYCYCIRGQQMCVRPKCHLNVDGCVARYQSGYTCCPSHYNCDIPSNGSHGENEDETDSLLSNKVTSCNVEGHDFEVGVAVPSNGHCQTCYCTQIGVVCRRLECSPTVPGCTPIIPEGHCCPTQYKCDPKILNNTQGPISHSTDNYDVTVISTGTEGTSSQASRTENPESTTENGEERSGTVTNQPETSTGTSSEKHKITVELSEESDLESISVIPEENIAVLVLTTEKESDDGKEPHDAYDEITNETITIEDSTTKQAATSFINAKRKAKPTKPTISKDKESTKFSTLEDITNLVTSTASHEETVKYNTDSEGDEKDAYAYDYGEVYDDVTHDVKQTFSAFSDYSQPEYSETLSTQRNQEITDSSKLKNKVKYNVPSTAILLATKFNTPTTKDESYRSTITDHPTYTIPNDPNRYTIYSTDRTQTSYAKDITETLVTKQKLAQKHRRPDIITKHQQTILRTQSTKPIDLTTSPGTPMKEINDDQTIRYDTSTEKRTIVPYTTETQTHRPKIRTTHPTNKKSLNHRSRPQRPLHLTVPRRTTQPIPQELADFLWSITQLQNTQTEATSTEKEDTTKHSESFSGTQNYSPETLSPIAIAAPKLIMEESTPGNAQEPTQTESTEVEPNPVSPSFNFQSPEIIFSNHGPSYNQKPDVPLIINNHKKTSTRLRPPIRSRPQTTPSLEDTFVEISNHKPTSTIRRPPGKFPPYPHFVNRPDSGYHRDPHLRDSHPKLHRIEPDFNPNHAEDYEEYYYDSDRDHQTTSKVFNNIQSQQSPSANTVNENLNPPSINSESDHTTTIKNESQSYTATSSDHEITNSEVTKSSKLSTTPAIPTESIQLTHKSKGNPGDIEGRSSEETAKDATEDSVKIDVSTTPKLKTTYYITPTITTTTRPVDIYTTKSFSGYVTNKYKGTSSFVTGSDAKHFRAEDNNKEREKGFIDHRLNENGGRPSQNSPTYSDKQMQNPSVLPALNITQSPPEAEDSQEITDVCFVDGRYYTSGELIVKSNPCEMCKCFYGHPLCQVQQCPPPPGPSCILEYLPGYCCPSVTCGVQTDPDQPPGIVSAPEPTSQEIRPPPAETDNQWKPLPHGPIVRTTESSFKTEPHITEDKQQEPKNNKEKIELTQPQEQIANKNILVDQWQQQQITTISTTTEQPSTTLPTTLMAMTTLPSVAETTEMVTTPPPLTTLTPTTDEELTTVSVPSTTSVWLNPIFDPDFNDDKAPNNKSEIHDNSSGVRKILDGFITLPPSKVVLSPGDSSDISTVLPVIITHPTTTEVPEELGIELVTIAGVDLFGQSTDLGGNLKVSGCNVYGKYYKINDKVTVLSKPCSDCICSADGISCNATC